MHSATKKFSVKNFFKNFLVFGVLASLLFSPIFSVQAVGVPANTYTGEETGNTTDGSCNVFGGGTGIANCLSGLVYIFTVGLGSAFAWVGASFLNYAVHLSLDSAAYALDFVATGWTTARDIANMAFIFILIYLAVTIMFQAQTAHSMQTLAGVIVIALIINFSFFFTRLVIDAGNLLSVQFYNAIIASNPTVTVNTGFAGQVAVPDITASIMQGLDLQTALGSDSFKQFAKSQEGLEAFGPYLIAMSFIFIAVGAMFFMLAATFLTAGVKFIIRIVVLWFMIIASPLALAVRASGIHSLEHYYRDWQSNLIKHAFYPVAFLFVFWILSKFMADMNKDGNLSAVFNDINNIASDGNFIVNLGVLIATIAIRLGFVVAILYVGIRAADRVGTMGATWAQNFGQKVSLGGLSGYTRGLRWVGGTAINQTAGRGAYALNKTLTNTRFGVENRVGRTLRKNVLQPVAGASLGGAKSITKITEEKKTVAKEVKTGLRDIETHELIHKAAHSDTLEAAEIKKLQGLSKREIEHLSPEDMKAVAKHLGEDGIKTIRASDAFVESDKDIAEENWHENSNAAPLQKSEKVAQELQETNTKLGDIQYEIGNQTYKLSELLKAGQKINKKSLGDIKEAFSQKQERAKADREEQQFKLGEAIKNNRPSAEIENIKKSMSAAETTQRNTADAIKKIDKLGEDIGKIPANPKATPPRPEKGEFIKK